MQLRPGKPNSGPLFIYAMLALLGGFGLCLYLGMKAIESDILQYGILAQSVGCLMVAAAIAIRRRS